jgi:hypothetical protein
MSKAVMKQDVLDFHLILSKSTSLIEAYCLQTRTINGLHSIQPEDVLTFKPKKKDCVSHVDEDRNESWQALQENNTKNEDLGAGIC